jgi:uncharacterized damage-inducible protein DinB
VSWKELLTREIEHEYKATEGLIDLVKDGDLAWKPPTGKNWMTTAQLLRHLVEGTGMAFRGVVTGDWGMPAGVDLSSLPPEEMLPPAEKMPAADRKLALEMVGRVSEQDLEHKHAPVPWDPTPMVLGHRLLQMVGHLVHHKCQLFYYLKTQGKPVNTGNLWGA